MKAHARESHQQPLADRLRGHTSEIMALWEKRVRVEVAPARKLEPSKVKDSIPNVLENLAQALEQIGKSERPEIKVAHEHGEQRALIPGYSIEQIIFEYRLLRRAIFDVLGTELPIDANERDTIIDAIEMGISEATASFASYQYRLREQFISTLAHDLRNPLTSAKTSAQLILRFPEKIDNVQILSARIVSTIDQTDRMIRDLLDSNQVRSGKALPLTVEYGDLRVIAKMTLEETASAIGDHFELVVAPQSPRIFGYWDISLLSRAISNLATNAVKYGEFGGSVRVTASAFDDEVSIEVHNEGVAISPDELETIFDPFQRTQSAKRGGKIGWGIGLSLVRGVAESHGGKVSVESQPKTGTTFTLTLPRDCRVKKPRSAKLKAVSGGKQARKI